MRTLLLGCVAALALSGCGSREATVAKTEDGKVTTSGDGSFNVSTTDGGSATVAIRGDAMAEAAAEISGLLPAFAPMYPGSQVRSTIRGSDGGGSSGRVITLETRDSLADVVKFYDSRIESAGADAQMRMDQGDSAMRMVTDKEGRTGTMIAVSDGGSFRTITITVGQEGSG